MKKEVSGLGFDPFFTEDEIREAMGDTIVRSDDPESVLSIKSLLSGEVIKGKGETLIFDGKWYKINGKLPPLT